MKKRINPDDKKVTIYDVAERAGVSLATVSRVINNSNVVKASTKAKVQKVIEELDFKPNEIARGLAKSKTTTIAVVFPESLFAHVKEMIGGIGDTCRSLGYNVIFYTTDDIGKQDDVIGNVVRQRVDGVVIFNSDQLENQFKTLINYNIPVVVIGATHTQYLPEGAEIVENDENKKKNPAYLSASVFGDIEGLAYDIVKAHLEKGKANIAYTKSKQNIINDQWVENGAKKAYDEMGADFTNFTQISLTGTYEQDLKTLQEYFDSHRHDVVISNYDKEAFAVAVAAKDHGINVPDDMEIFGMFNTSYAEMSSPRLTSVNIPVYNMGAIAVRLLTKILGDDVIDSREIALKCFTVTRDSTK